MKQWMELSTDRYLSAKELATLQIIHNHAAKTRAGSPLIRLLNWEDEDETQVSARIAPWRLYKFWILMALNFLFLSCIGQYSLCDKVPENEQGTLLGFSQI